MTKGFGNLGKNHRQATPIQGVLVQGVREGLFAAITLMCLLAMLAVNAQTSEFEFPAVAIGNVKDVTDAGFLTWTHNGKELHAGIALGINEVGYYDGVVWQAVAEKDGFGPKLGSIYDFVDLTTITINLGGGAPKDYTIAAVATDDYEGQFRNLGDIVLTDANVTDGGVNNAYGFLSVGTYDGILPASASPFTGTIDGSKVTVTGTGEIIGVYFKGGFASGTGKQDIGAGAIIEFGDIAVETDSNNLNPAEAGAAGFAARNVDATAEITLGNVKATAATADWATGAEFVGDVEGKLTITSLTAKAKNHAHGLRIDGDAKGTIKIGEGSVLPETINVTGEKSAFGIDIRNNMAGGTVIVNGDIEATSAGATGQSAGIWIGNDMTDGTITVTGDIEATSTGAAGQSAGIRIGNDITGGAMTGGEIEVTGEIKATGGALAAGFSSEGDVDGDLIFNKITAEATEPMGQAAGINITDGTLAGTILVHDTIKVTATGGGGAGIRLGEPLKNGSITGSVTTQNITVIALQAWGLSVLDDVENTGIIDLGAITLGEAAGTKVLQGAGIWVGGKFEGKLNVEDIIVHGGTLGTIAAGDSLSGISIVGDFILADGSSIGKIEVTADSSAADEHVYGIVVGGDAEFTLTKDIKVENTGFGNATAIALQGATAESIITIDGTLTVSGIAAPATFGDAISVENDLTLDLVSSSVLTLVGFTHVKGDLNVTGGGEIKTTMLNAVGDMTLGNMALETAIKISSATTLDTLDLHADTLNVGQGVAIDSVGNMGIYTNVLNVGADATINSGGDMFVNQSTITIDVGSSALITPAISAVGDIDFDNSNLTFNIVTYSKDMETDFTIISAGGTLDHVGVISAGAVGGADYLWAEAKKVGEEILLKAGLTWEKDDDTAHGTFDIAGPANNFFVVDTELKDNDKPDPLKWDGKSLIKDGAGRLILAKANEYTGDTTVEAGTLQIGMGDAGSVLGDVIVKGGTLEIGDGGVGGSVGGDIILDAAGTNVVFNRSNSYTYDGIISGDGNLTKNGGGTLTLTGANTYTGLTTVAGGTLLVNGSLGSNATPTAGVVVQNGATLGGNGTIYGNINVIAGTLSGTSTIHGNVIIRSGATFSPGNSIGDVEVFGNFTFESGSIYEYEIGRPASDTLVVHGGVVTIEDVGGSPELRIVTLDGLAPNSGKYIVIDLRDGATFDDPTKLFELVYDPLWNGQFTTHLADAALGEYYLMWERNHVSYADAIRAIGTPNAIRAARGLDKLVLDGHDITNIENIYKALDGLFPDERALANALAQLHGEVFASSKEAAVQMQHRFQTLLPNGRDLFKVSDSSIRGQVHAMPKLWNRWGTFTGDYRNRNKFDGFSGYEAASAGLALGVDKAVSALGLFGVAVGYDYVDQNFNHIRSNAEIEAFRAMLYNSWFNGDFYCDTYAGYTKNWYSTHRKIEFPGFPVETVKSKYDDDLGSFGIELGRVWSLGWGMMTPSLGVHYNFISSPTVVEKGGLARLRVAGSDYHSVRLPIGIKLSRLFPWDHGSVWMPELRAHYIRELANDTVEVRTAFAGAPGVGFAATNGVRGRDNVRVGLGLGFLVANRVNFRLDYDCDIYNNTTANSFGATLGVSF